MTGLVNVKDDCGAAGNGSTDDYNALQTALNAGGELNFPPGVYLTGSTLTIPTGVSLRGLGTAGDNRTGAGASVIIKAKNNLNSAIFNTQGSYGIQASNILFDANGANQSTAAPIIDGTHYTADRFLGHLFQNCGFINTKAGHYAVEYKCTGGLIAHPRFDNCLWYNNLGGAFDATDRVVWPEFVGCKVYYNTAPSGGAVMRFINSNCYIQGCNLESNTGKNIYLAAGAQVTDTAFIQGNDIESTNNDFLIHCLNMATKTLIQGNGMNCVAGVGIKMESCSGFNVTGNTIVSSSSAGGDGILVTGTSRDWQIYGNNVKGFYTNEEIANGSDYYILSLNNAVGSVDNGGGTHKIVNNNL